MAALLPSNLTFDIKSAEIMCRVHILILSSTEIRRIIKNISAVVRGTVFVPRLVLTGARYGFRTSISFNVSEVRFPYLD